MKNSLRIHKWTHNEFNIFILGVLTRPPRVCCSLYNNVNFPVSLVLVSSEYPQQHEEEVDEDRKSVV